MGEHKAAERPMTIEGAEHTAHAYSAVRQLSKRCSRRCSSQLCLWAPPLSIAHNHMRAQGNGVQLYGSTSIHSQYGRF